MDNFFSLNCKDNINIKKKYTKTIKKNFSKGILFKKSQYQASILVVLGLVLIVGGYIGINVLFNEKKNNKIVTEIVTTSSQEDNYKKTFFEYELKECLDSLVREALANSFREVINRKKIKDLEGYPVVLDGENKVNINFEDLSSYIKNYVNDNFYQCQLKVYDYKESLGKKIYLELKNFDVLKDKWYADVDYIIYDLNTLDKNSGSLTYERQLYLFRDLLKLYNGLIDYEFKNKVIEKQLFTFIYNPSLYSAYYGYPTSNYMLAEQDEIVFDLDKTRNKIKEIISVIVPLYRVFNTENSLKEFPESMGNPEAYELNFLDDFIIGANVWFEPLLDDVKINFSVIEGSNAFIEGNKLIVRSNDLASISSSGNTRVNSLAYDLFYDMEIPILVKIKYNNVDSEFVMVLRLNNNLPSNKSWEEIENDNTVNTEPLSLNPANSKCPFKEEGVNVRVEDIEGNGIEGAKVISRSLSYTCDSVTDSNGFTKLVIPCINCEVYAYKNGYFSEKVVYPQNNDLNSLKIQLFKPLSVNVWTIYTPKIILDNWGNDSFSETIIKFQGVNPEEVGSSSKENPFVTIRLEPLKENTLGQVTSVLLLNNKEVLYWYDDGDDRIEKGEYSFLTNGFRVLEKMPYKIKIMNESGQFEDTNIITEFNNKFYYFEDKNNNFLECEPRIFKFKLNINPNKELYLIKINGNYEKVIEFPYYNGIIFAENSNKVYSNSNYLAICLPRSYNIEPQVIKYVKNEEGKWVKREVGSFNSLFEEIAVGDNNE